MLLQAFVCLLCFCLFVCCKHFQMCLLSNQTAVNCDQEKSHQGFKDAQPHPLIHGQHFPCLVNLRIAHLRIGYLAVLSKPVIRIAHLTLFFILSACYRFWVYRNDCHSVLWDSPCNRKTLFLTNSALDDVSCRLLLTKRKPGSYNQPKHANTLQ